MRTRQILDAALGVTNERLQVARLVIRPLPFARKWRRNRRARYAGGLWSQARALQFYDPSLVAEVGVQMLTRSRFTCLPRWPISTRTRQALAAEGSRGCSWKP